MGRSPRFVVRPDNGLWGLFDVRPTDKGPDGDDDREILIEQFNDEADARRVAAFCNANHRAGTGG